MDPMAIGCIELNDLNMGTELAIVDAVERSIAQTPPDLGIFTTAIRFPYVRCISTFSFSCPTTRIVLTIKDSY